ncbi:MAG: DEAD/DEAH box helicase, partial [Spirochaetales bacterium]|nr:DEAD/DEAH box helicase [Spirochaetales bacterium]
MGKVKTALKLCGFPNPTPFQQQVIPAIFSGRDIIAETKHAKGRVITFLLPLLIRQFPKKVSPSVIILTDSLPSVRRIENNYTLLNSANKFKASLAFLGHNGNAGNDLPLFRKKPCIIVGTTSRIIDHIRRNNIVFTDIDSLIIDVPDESHQTGFEQDVLFIASKLNRKTQIQIFVNNFNQLSKLDKLLNHAQILLYTDREKFDIITKGESSVNTEKLEAKIQSIVQGIKANPDNLTEYRKIIKKNVPIFLRSYFAAKLLLDSEGPFTKTTKKYTSGNMKTLFVSIGRRRRVHPRDLMKFFQKSLDIKSTEIGPIKVLDNYSFIDLDEKLCTI